MGHWARLAFSQFGILSAALIFFLEGFGAPLPVEIPLLIIGRAQVRGLFSYWEMVLLMWLSTVAGNTVGYLIGSYGGRPLITRMAGWFHIRPESLTRVEHWFNRWGLWLTLATRWANWGFAQNMWLCGITRVPFGRFLLVMTVNDFFWAMAWTWAAAALYRQLDRMQMLLHYPARVAGALATLAAAGALIWWWRRRRRPPATP